MKFFTVTIERTVRQTLTLTRMGYDSGEAIEKAMDEANDSPVYLGWEDANVIHIECLGVERAYREYDDE